MAGQPGRSGGPRRNAGGARRGAGRPRKALVLVELGVHHDPLQFLLEVMRSNAIELRLRIIAAKALMPYLHRCGQQHQPEPAKKPARFATAPPPLKIVR